MDIVTLAEQIAAQHFRSLDPAEGVVEEAASEFDHGKTWAVLLRPTGDWVYLLGYIPEHGWALVRIKRDKLNGPTPTTAADYETLGVHTNRVNATALALSLMEGQP